MPDVDRLQARGPVAGMHGMVASEHPLVSQTGVAVLRRGGNAFDAALAMSAVLPVVKPGRSHLGGDAYILAYPKREGRVTAICSGGKAPMATSLAAYADGMPPRGGKTIAIPGLVDAWQVFRDRWCSMPMADALAPAIGYAREGFAVSRELELLLAGTQGMFTKYTGLAQSLYIDGAPPRTGQVLRQPALAATLDAVAHGGRAAFYEGAIAQQIAEGVQATGGYVTAEDLRSHSADVAEPLYVDYRGYTVYETPPNSQGLILLEELNIIEGYDVAGWGHLSGDAIHHMVEAKKLAFEDRQRFAGDPSFVDFDAMRLLTKEHAASRRGEIDPERARASAIAAASSDTTSFVVADAAGNCCSFIQSVYAPFGSAICLPELGIIMNNRMCGFSLDPAHPNALAPGKRTMHTLNTYMVFRDGRPYLIGNTPGADFQVQTNLQVITGVLDFALDPQAAVDAARWGDTPDGLLIEDDMPEHTSKELARRGHDVRLVAKRGNGTGRPQAIVIDGESGAFIGGSDSRGEGGAAGW
ncbi:MAG: gamma-glutamyltransferase [Dehalococcoidia bacterium]